MRSMFFFYQSCFYLFIMSRHYYYFYFTYARLINVSTLSIIQGVFFEGVVEFPGPKPTFFKVQTHMTHHYIHNTWRNLILQE